MRKIWAICLLLGLSACDQPLPPEAFAPANPEFYTELQDDYFLKHKVQVDKVVNARAEKDLISPASFKAQLNTVFKQAGLAAPVKPSYTLNATIKDYRTVGFAFFSEKGAAAVEYELVDAATEETVFSKTITSTQEEKKPLFADAAPIMIKAMATALGENIAQITRELTLVEASDVGAKEKAAKSSKKRKKQ